MEELVELQRQLREERPAPWESLPDISLYMDQLIGYMPRQLAHNRGAESLTSAMVNNYIKDGLLPRADGKRYNRTHLAYLTQICALKQVLPVKEAGALAAYRSGETVRGHYDNFRAQLDAALKETADRLDPDCTEDALYDLALDLALRSYADKLACQQLLANLHREESREKGRKSRKEL